MDTLTTKIAFFVGGSVFGALFMLYIGAWTDQPESRPNAQTKHTQHQQAMSIQSVNNSESIAQPEYQSLDVQLLSEQIKQNIQPLIHSEIKNLLRAEFERYAMQNTSSEELQSTEAQAAIESNPQRLQVAQQKANSIVDAAVERGNWTVEDTLNFAKEIQSLSGDSLLAAHDRLNAAITSGEISDVDAMTLQ